MKKFKSGCLITFYNTYASVTNNYIHPSFLSKKKYPNKKSEPKYKVPLRKRNSRIIQAGHALPWSTFITLTISTQDYYWGDYDKIQQLFRKLIRSLYWYTHITTHELIETNTKKGGVKLKFKKKHINKLKYLAVIEHGDKTSRIHYHMVTNIKYENKIFEYSEFKKEQIERMGDEFYGSKHDRKILPLWEFGWSDVKEVNNENCNAVFYMIKYLSKNKNNRTPIGKREVFSSRGLNKVRKVFLPKNVAGIKGYTKSIRVRQSDIYYKNR